MRSLSLRRPAPSADPTIVDQVLRALGASDPKLAAASRKADEKRVADRQALADGIARIEAEAEAALPNLAAKEREAEAAFVAARAAFDAASAAWAAAQHDRRVAADGYQSRAERLRRQLRDGASPRLIELRMHLADLHQDLRQVPITAELIDKRRNPFTDKPVSDLVQTNVPSIKARQRAILAAIDACEAAKLEPDQDAAVARIEMLIEQLPSPLEIVIAKVEDVVS